MKLLPSSSIVLLIVQLSTTVAQSTCGANEVYTKCTSSSCFEESCSDVLFAEPRIKKCTKDCKRGCKCKQGFFRNHDGRCVDELTCVMCGYEEDWIEFDDDLDDYESTCDDLLDDEFEDGFQGQTRMEPVLLPGEKESFDEGDEDEDDLFGGMCTCAKDKYRSIDGLCISEKSCLECDMNEVYEPCGSSGCWEYTCDDALVPMRERLMRPCTLDCQSGCKCHPGFYRDSASGQCVLAADCLESPQQ